MLNNGLLVVLALFSFAIVANAENQLESTEKATIQEDAKKIRPFSKINEKTNQEEIYAMTAEQAKALPTETDPSKLTAEQKKTVEATIKAIVSNKPVKVVALAANEKEATTACYRYYGYYYNDGYNYNNGYYYNNGCNYNYGCNYNSSCNYNYGCNSYYGGGAYYYNGNYRAVWGYRGRYNNCWWG